MDNRQLFEIKGTLEVPEGTTAIELNYKFVDWVEAQGYYFGGGINGPIEDDEDG